MGKTAGWIKIDRNLLEWRWVRHPITLAVWIHLLLRANYKDVEIGTDVVRRGEVYIAQDLLATDIGITKKQLRTALEHLKETGEIRAQRRIGKTLVISIPNYDKYQGEGQRNGSERATKGQHIKKDKKDKNILSPPLPPSSKPYTIPTIEEVREYERSTSSGKDPDLFYKHYSRLEWKANNKPIYNWRKLYDIWEAPPQVLQLVQDRPKTFTDEDGITYEWVDGSYERVRKHGKD